MSLTKHRLLAATPLALALLMVSLPASAAAADEKTDVPRAEGIWQGVLESSGQRLRLVVHIRRGPDAMLAGTLDSIDQRAMGLPLGAINVTEDVLSFQVAQIGARYAGNFYGNDTIRGIWSQGLNSLPLVLRRGDDVPATGRAAPAHLSLPCRFNPLLSLRAAHTLYEHHSTLCPPTTISGHCVALGGTSRILGATEPWFL